MGAALCRRLRMDSSPHNSQHPHLRAEPTMHCFGMRLATCPLSFVLMRTTKVPKPLPVHCILTHTFSVEPTASFLDGCRKAVRGLRPRSSVHQAARLCHAPFLRTETVLTLHFSGGTYPAEREPVDDGPDLVLLRAGWGGWRNRARPGKRRQPSATAGGGGVSMSCTSPLWLHPHRQPGAGNHIMCTPSVREQQGGLRQAQALIRPATHGVQPQGI